MTFHINDNGDPGKCSAQKGNCPFGATEAHFDTAQEARGAYEAQQESFLLRSLSKKEQKNKLDTKKIKFNSDSPGKQEYLYAFAQVRRRLEESGDDEYASYVDGVRNLVRAEHVNRLNTIIQNDPELINEVKEIARKRYDYNRSPEGIQEKLIDNNFKAGERAANSKIGIPTGGMARKMAIHETNPLKLSKLAGLVNDKARNTNKIKLFSRPILAEDDWSIARKELAANSNVPTKILDKWTYTGSLHEGLSRNTNISQSALREIYLHNRGLVQHTNRAVAEAENNEQFKITVNVLKNPKCTDELMKEIEFGDNFWTEEQRDEIKKLIEKKRSLI